MRQRSSARLASGGGAPAVAAAGGRQQALLRLQAAAARRRAAAATAARAREVQDDPRELRDKCRRLARAIRNAKHLVVYTGAGISTAADIPDYRGPRGVWTRLRNGEAVPRVEVSRAQPTFTHMALTALWARGRLRFVVSQNCDGLHLRSGLPRRALAELHGDMFVELCSPCRRVYLRAFDTTERTARYAHTTRRLCHACGAELRDSIVHFGERGRAAWPLNWAGALRHAAAADVILCLGSSLKVLRRYPRLWSMSRPPHARPRLYIVNLQWTPKDASAALKINARCDEVMAQVARRLRLRVPEYCARRDPLLAHAVPPHPAERHTLRRRPLSPPPPQHASAGEPSEPSSPSASDSEEERPLARLRPAPPAAPASPAPPALAAFQVALAGGAATLLLRAEHARASPPPAPAPPAPAPGATRPLSDLRRFRMRRPSPPPPAPHPVDPELDEKPPWLRRAPADIDCKEDFKMKCHSDGEDYSEVKCDPELTLEDFKVKFDADIDVATNGTLHMKDDKSRLSADEDSKRNGVGAASDGWSSSSSSSGCSRAARAYVRRAVLLCRHRLYPGLHTVLCPAPAPAPPPPGTPPRVQCAWCWRRHGARRCLWYGPADARGTRVWRRAGRRRYLCACCGDEDAAAEAEEPSEEPEVEAPGWFGKGYRKARRRRR